MIHAHRDMQRLLNTASGTTAIDPVFVSTDFAQESRKIGFPLTFCAVDRSCWEDYPPSGGQAQG
jgi:hypothetical protein